MMSAKNTMLSPAAADLGLGDALRQQVEDTIDERKKKLLRQAQIAQGPMASIGPATQSLFSGAGSYSV